MVTKTDRRRNIPREPQGNPQERATGIFACAFPGRKGSQYIVVRVNVYLRGVVKTKTRFASLSLKVLLEESGNERKCALPGWSRAKDQSDTVRKSANMRSSDISVL
jgi:hypothetical protein